MEKMMASMEDGATVQDRERLTDLTEDGTRA
jgi:hypothetical protein